MKNIRTKILKICMMMFLVTTMIAAPMKIIAASVIVSASASSVYVGDSVTFTVSANNGAGYLTVSGATSDYAWFDNSSQSYTVTASSPGTITISVSGVLADYDTEVDNNVAGSATVTVLARDSQSNSSGGSSSNGNSNTTNAPATPTPETPTDNPDDNKSSDNTLSSIVVSKGTLDPVFDSSIKDYKLVLSADTTSLSVEATATDSKASVSGTGEINVKPGDNRIALVVTAENGSEEVYTINAYVDEKPDIFMKVHGKDYGVIVNVDELPSPAGFEKITLSYNGKDIPAWKNNVTNITLVYLIDEQSVKNFYIYENNVITSVYIPMALLGLEVAVIDIPDDMKTRKGMEFTDVEIDGHTLPGWIFTNEKFANYSLVYLMNDKGDKVFYQYEKTSNTLQMYSGAAAITQEEFESLSSMNFYLMIACGILGLAVVVLFVLWIHARKRKKRPRKSLPANDERESEEPQTYENYDEDNEQAHRSVEASYQQPVNDEPQYHRKRSSKPLPPSSQPVSKQTKQDVDFGTQPFRFHDDFDDQQLK